LSKLQDLHHCVGVLFELVFFFDTVISGLVRAVDLVTERFPLSLSNTEAYGTCRHRRAHHGFCGVLEFSVTLQADESSNHR